MLRYPEMAPEHSHAAFFDAWTEQDACHIAMYHAYRQGACSHPYHISQRLVPDSQPKEMLHVLLYAEAAVGMTSGANTYYQPTYSGVHNKTFTHKAGRAPPASRMPLILNKQLMSKLLKTSS
jgi:hypothetical protein